MRDATCCVLHVESMSNRRMLPTFIPALQHIHNVGVYLHDPGGNGAAHTSWYKRSQNKKNKKGWMTLHVIGKQIMAGGRDA